MPRRLPTPSGGFTSWNRNNFNRLDGFDRLFQPKYCPRRRNVWYNIVIAKETEIGQVLADGIDENFPGRVIFIWTNYVGFHRFDSGEPI
jgi:hypothetical protein